MTFKLTHTAFVDATGGDTTYALSSMLSFSPAGHPAYLVVNVLDRNEYTAGATGSTGALTGGGATLDLAPIGGDGRGAGIVFTWQAATDQYFNPVYGKLSGLSYTDSSSPNDVTSLSFFGTGNAALAQAAASNAYALMQGDAQGYIGSVTFATTKAFATSPAAQATPNGIAQAARALVGHSWNNEGCWVLASTIAAEAGAGLPVQTTAVGLPGAANGEWVTLYDGPAGSTGAWQSLVSAGDMVVFATSATTGHITTCVSGSGASAMLVDNITYVGANGQIANSAHDGAANDVLIAPPHPASQEFAGVSASSVVIYALDTPVVSDLVARASVSEAGSVSLQQWLAASDPAHRAVTAYQVYSKSAADTILLDGKAVRGEGAAMPVTAATLSGLSFLAGVSPNVDTLEIRASNGAYWGDWQSLAVSVTAPSPAAAGFGPLKADWGGSVHAWPNGASSLSAIWMAALTHPDHHGSVGGTTLALPGTPPGVPALSPPPPPAATERVERFGGLPGANIRRGRQVLLRLPMFDGRAAGEGNELVCVHVGQLGVDADHVGRGVHIGTAVRDHACAVEDVLRP